MKSQAIGPFLGYKNGQLPQSGFQTLTGLYVGRAVYKLRHQILFLSQHVAEKRTKATFVNNVMLVKYKPMKVSVWDNYVKRADGKTMHFDILVPSTLEDKEKIFAFGKDFLSKKPFQVGELSSKECRFCHIERAPQNIIESIQAKGFHIIEMENCA